ncbi:MAG: sulfatase-like hydrolase/transferase [Pirellulaceae bacterium]
MSLISSLVCQDPRSHHTHENFSGKWLRPSLLTSCCWLALGLSPGWARSPNIIIILTEDMGYADLKAFGPSEIPTPQLDRLAAEGTRCTHAYTAAPICVPARIALLSGRYPARFGIDNNNLSHRASSNLAGTDHPG